MNKRELPDEQLSMSDIAVKAGITYGAITGYRGRGYLPEPDGYVGNSPWWWGNTVSHWIENRPGQGKKRAER